MYQTQEMPVLRTHADCEQRTASYNEQQYLVQMREVQTDDRIFALGLLLGMAVIAVWALKFVYGM